MKITIPYKPRVQQAYLHKELPYNINIVNQYFYYILICGVEDLTILDGS